MADEAGLAPKDMPMPMSRGELVVTAGPILPTFGPGRTDRRRYAPVAGLGRNGDGQVCLMGPEQRGPRRLPRAARLVPVPRPAAAGGSPGRYGTG
ncbi:hypothetical protein JCM4814A_49370 [Streptomyces phaeofaciens JCM 4814]|uniref:Uncharacterized protein n=1 Tax=Streptomyces phaeofaciens TaxID=68254 RepID=A0A918H251_9ACTN|nr:hypothetical protein GCM10010226_06030 [Streptomyces phaeofaciens]